MEKLLFIFLFISSSAWAQEPFHYFINTESGLPTNEVYDILVSKKNGMLYIATNKGLARYNGSVVEEIEIPGNPELSITSLDEDQYGNVYFISFKGGIWCYDGNVVFLIKQLTTTRYGYPNLEVYADKLLMFSKDNFSFYTYEPQQKLLDSVRVKTKLNSKTMLNFYGRDDDEVFFRIDQEKYSFKKGSMTLLGSGVCLPRCQFLLNGTNFILGSNNSKGEKPKDYATYYLQLTNGEYQNPQRLDEVNGLFVNQASVLGKELYASTSKGVFIYDEQFNFKQNWFSKANISFIVQDGSGTIWLSTLNNGIIVIPNKEILNQTAVFGDNLVTNLLSTDDGLAYVSNNKYDEWPSANKLSRTISTQAFMYQTEQFPNAISFVNTQKNFIYQKNKTPKLREMSLSSGLKWASYFTEDTQEVLVSTFGNLSYNGSKKTIENFSKKYKFERIVNLEDTQFGYKSCIFLAYEATYTHYYNRSTGLIYLGTRNGFFILTPDKKQVELKWKGQEIQSDFLYPTTKGDVVWSGGRTGLYKLKNGKVLKHWAKADGLLRTRIDRLRQQGDTLIVIFEKGVQLFTEDEGIFSTYTSANCLPKSACIDGAIYNNQLYVSTQKGVYSVPLVKQATDRLEVSIASLWSKNNRLTDGEKIQYKNNSLHFKINGTALNSRGDFTYQYRLKPTGKEWTTQSSVNNEIHFNSLREGDYVLEVKLRSGSEESKIDRYRFSIAPPWYRSILFYVLCALLFLAIIATLFYLRVRQIRKKAEYDKRIKQSEITAIKAQMNPHFVFNALNSVQNLVIKKDFENTNEYLGMFSDLVRKTLEHSGKNEILLSEEIEMLNLYLDIEKLRFRDTIHIKFNVHVEEEFLNQILLPPLLIQPYIENVFKHGLMHKEGFKELNITISKENEKLIIEIVDNGVGRKMANALENRGKHKSLSTSANQKRMELLSEVTNEKIEVNITDAFPEKEECGTRVILQLPIINPH